MKSSVDASANLSVTRRELVWIWFQGLSMGKSVEELKSLLVCSSETWQSGLSAMSRRLVEIEGSPSGDWVAFKSMGKAGSTHSLTGPEALRLERGSWTNFLTSCVRDRVSMIELPKSEGLQEVLNAMPSIGIKGISGARIHPLRHGVEELSGETMSRVLSVLFDRVDQEHPQLADVGRKLLPLLTCPGYLKVLSGSIYSPEVLPLVMEWEMPGYGSGSAAYGVLELRVAVSCTDAMDPIEFYAGLAQGHCREFELTHVPSEVVNWLIRACVLVDVEMASFLPYAPVDDEVPVLRTGAAAALELLGYRQPGFLIPIANPELVGLGEEWETPDSVKSLPPEAIVEHWKAFIHAKVSQLLSC